MKSGGKVFSVTDCTGRKVVLLQSTLKKHILPLHPEQYLVERIRQTLIMPLFVHKDVYGGLRYYSRVS